MCDIHLSQLILSKIVVYDNQHETKKNKNQTVLDNCAPRYNLNYNCSQKPIKCRYQSEWLPLGPQGWQNMNACCFVLGFHFNISFCFQCLRQCKQQKNQHKKRRSPIKRWPMSHCQSLSFYCWSYVVLWAFCATEGYITSEKKGWSLPFVLMLLTIRSELFVFMSKHKILKSYEGSQNLSVWHTKALSLVIGCPRFPPWKCTKEEFMMCESIALFTVKHLKFSLSRKVIIVYTDCVNGAEFE